MFFRCNKRLLLPPPARRRPAPHRCVLPQGFAPFRVRKQIRKLSSPWRPQDLGARQRIPSVVGTTASAAENACTNSRESRRGSPPSQLYGMGRSWRCSAGRSGGSPGGPGAPEAQATRTARNRSTAIWQIARRDMGRNGHQSGAPTDVRWPDDGRGPGDQGHPPPPASVTLDDEAMERWLDPDWDREDSWRWRARATDSPTTGGA